MSLKGRNPLNWKSLLKRYLSYSTPRYQDEALQNAKAFSGLKSKIDHSILTSEHQVSQDTVVNTIKKCRDLQHMVYDYDKFWRDGVNISIRQTIRDIVLNANVDFNKNLLKEILLLKLPVATNVEILESFYQRNPKDFVDKKTGLVALRHSLFNGDLQNALKIIDLSTGHDNYIRHKDSQMKKSLLKLASSAAGITFFSKVGVYELIEAGWLSATWGHLSSINAMILTYLLNSSFFITIVRLGRNLQASGGDYLTWQKGTFYTHWYKHFDELSMCTKVVEADVILNGGGPSGAEPSSELIDKLCSQDDTSSREDHKGETDNKDKNSRLMERKENIEDVKLQAYWMSGGDGFEWVEPDQDPAVIIWKRHLDKFNKPELNQNSRKLLNWTDELIRE